ncbi:hypothetical protein CEXT_808401 [Caerostris extrusa]|uniref:Uncharacterized protein n=1 Tax=Caerostris extrusa TaxID=172846 RepID=A0AAV4N9I6_CAEEX|nr:hypothetical protein CEXT_808401 [Caerostris extrusa]
MGHLWVKVIVFCQGHRILARSQQQNVLLSYQWHRWSKERESGYSARQEWWSPSVDSSLRAMMGLLTRIHSFYLPFIRLRFRKIVFSKNSE